MNAFPGDVRGKANIHCPLGPKRVVARNKAGISDVAGSCFKTIARYFVKRILLCLLS
jgi:hypothetical protein